MTAYGDEFFSNMTRSATRSAGQIVPLLIELIQPRSVIDVGCGTGAWLAMFVQHGVEDVHGVDGAWVDQSRLQISRDRFVVVDLKQPLRFDRQFDLVLALEVAEHLPLEHADVLTDSLAALGPTIAFSAAIPFQGGTDHVNEQWPEFWVERFSKRGFVVVDCIRARIWRNPEVAWFYAQNLLLFVREPHPDFLLRWKHNSAHDLPLSVVHPTKYLKVATEFEECKRRLAMLDDVVATIPVGERFVLVDQDEMRQSLLARDRAIPFTERNGEYWGPPADDATAIAIAELDRLRSHGPKFLVVAWPAFWWLDHYRGFAQHVRENLPCLLENERLIVFDLRERRA
jgi:SAM-dependent methyltransferase